MKKIQEIRLLSHGYGESQKDGEKRLKKLDEQAKKEKLPRTTVVRKAIDFYLDENQL